MILFCVVLVMKSNILLLLHRITPQIDIFLFVLLPSNKHNDFPYSAHSGVVGPKSDLGSQMWLWFDQLRSES